MDIFGLISNNETLYKYCSECKEYVKSDPFASLQDAHHALEQIVNYVNEKNEIDIFSDGFTI